MNLSATGKRHKRIASNVGDTVVYSGVSGSHTRSVEPLEGDRFHRAGAPAGGAEVCVFLLRWLGRRVAL